MGASATSFAIGAPMFPGLYLVFGPVADAITGAEEAIDSNIAGFRSSLFVCKQKTAYELSACLVG